MGRARKLVTLAAFQVVAFPVFIMGERSQRPLPIRSCHLLGLFFPLISRAQDQDEDPSSLSSLPDLSLLFSLILVFGAIAAGLSWVASLKAKRTDDGQPRSTSLYRVFQARMRAGEFAALAKEKASGNDKAKAETTTSGMEESDLDAFVDAYVDALEEDDKPSQSKESKDVSS